MPTSDLALLTATLLFTSDLIKHGMLGKFFLQLRKWIEVFAHFVVAFSPFLYVSTHYEPTIKLFLSCLDCMHTHFTKVIDCFHRVLGINYSKLEICEVRTCRRHLLGAHDCDDLLNTFSFRWRWKGNFFLLWKRLVKYLNFMKYLWIV